MKPQAIAAAVTATLAVGPAVAHAGTVAPDLQARVAGDGGAAEVPVIIHFADRLDLEALRGDLDRTLAQRYPDPQDRKTARKKVKRALLVDGLRRQARAGERRVQALLAARGARPDLQSLWLVNALAGRVPGDLIQALAALPGVERVALDAEVQGPGTGTAPTGPTNWNLDMTGAPALWLQGHTGSGVVVASVDTGVDASHPDLGPRWRGGAHDWFDPYGQHATPADANGHGTRVLGLVLAADAGYYQVGMAPDARWIAAKIFNDSNTATLSGIHQAYQWALDPDGDPLTDDAADIVNNSWDLANTVNQCVQEFAPDIALLKEAGIAVVFAGGNYGPNPNTSVSPANDPAATSVGAVDSSASVDYSSSRGVNACDGGVYPHLVAPGVSVWTTVRVADSPYYPYGSVSGTSFAVAHVSGAMALLMAAFPQATVSQVETALRTTAADRGGAGPDTSYGYGLMDVVAAHDWLAANVGGGAGGGPAGTLALGASAYSVNEQVAALTVTVNRTGGSAGAVSVSYFTTDGLARAGEDYQAAAGILTLADGEISRSFAVTLLDDGVYEGDEDFSITLADAQGGASLAAPQAAVVTVLDDETPGPADADGDGYTADLDCNDASASVFPGAPEVKHDGVDQDCNGYDLSIDVTRARYVKSKDQLALWATSDLRAQAGLSAVVGLADGRRLTRSMSWSASQLRWQLTLNSFVKQFGALPIVVTVSGVEGSESAPVEQRR